VYVVHTGLPCARVAFELHLVLPWVVFAFVQMAADMQAEKALAQGH